MNIMFYSLNYMIFFTQLIFLTLTNIITIQGQAIYTKNEIDALEKFRPLVNDVLIHDYHKVDSYLIRWLRAQNLNLNEAKQMLRKAMEWRKTNNIDNILNETLVDSFPYPDSTDGIDNNGNPVLTYTIANLDFRKYILEGKLKLLERIYTKADELMELRIREAAALTGKNISQFIGLGDLQGFNLRQHNCILCFQHWTTVFRNAETYYPGLRKHVIFINTPRAYEILFDRLKPFLSEETQKATIIFGFNRTDWSSFLLKHIPLDQRTYQFGGTKQ